MLYILSKYTNTLLEIDGVTCSIAAAITHRAVLAGGKYFIWKVTKAIDVYLQNAHAVIAYRVHLFL